MYTTIRSSLLEPLDQQYPLLLLNFYVYEKGTS